MEGCGTSWCVLVATFISLIVLAFDANTCEAARVLAARGKTVTSSTKFIRASCSGTVYPRLCLDSLSPHANEIQASPAQMAQAALSVSLTSAKSTSDTVSSLSVSGGMRPGEAAAVGDCMATMGDAVARIQRSLDAMGRLGGKGAGMEMGNMQTWMSAALTDENTCMGGFEGGHVDGGVGSTVRDQVVKAAQLTSNALSLVNGFAATIAAKKKP